jgi:hypothetical protein
MNIEKKIYAKLNNVKASEVAFNLNDEQIDEIANIVKQIIKMLQSCKKTPEDAVQVSHKPAESDKRAVKVAVRKELGFLKNLFSGGRYVKAVLDAGKEATINDVKEVW